MQTLTDLPALSAMASHGLTVLLDLFLISDHMSQPYIPDSAYRSVVMCLFHQLCVVQLDSIQRRRRKSGVDMPIKVLDCLVILNTTI